MRNKSNNIIHMWGSRKDSTTERIAMTIDRYTASTKALTIKQFIRARDDDPLKKCFVKFYSSFF